MPWNTIATTDVLEEFTPQETATLTGIQAAATNLAGILARVVGAARGSIAAGGNPLGDAATIPDQLRSDVVCLARWKWLISFPQLKALQTDARKTAAADAQQRLDDVAAGKLKVETPGGESPVVGPSIHKKHRQFTDCTQDGI